MNLILVINHIVVGELKGAAEQIIRVLRGSLTCGSDMHRALRVGVKGGKIDAVKERVMLDGIFGDELHAQCSGGRSCVDARLEDVGWGVGSGDGGVDEFA